jgi:hypothetical protein
VSSIAKTSKKDATRFREIAAARGGAAVFETDAGWQAPYALSIPRVNHMDLWRPGHG